MAGSHYRPQHATFECHPVVSGKNKKKEPVGRQNPQQSPMGETAFAKCGYLTRTTVPRAGMTNVANAGSLWFPA